MINVCSVFSGLNPYKPYIVLALLLLLLSVPAARLVNAILSLTLSKPQEYKFDQGVLIGILERFIILLLGIAGELGSVSIIIAAKTMVRYGEFTNDEKDIDEHKITRSKYLIGTLSSVLLGLIAYLIWISLQM